MPRSSRRSLFRGVNAASWPRYAHRRPREGVFIIDGEHEPTNGHATTPGGGRPMRVERTPSVEAYLERAGGFLEAHEAENNLVFGICSNVLADPTQYDAPPYLATVMHGDKVVGSAIRTPPWRLV